MHFRIKLCKENLNDFLAHVKLLSDIGDTAVVHLAEDSMRFVILSEDSHISTYSSVDTASPGTFKECSIASKTNNIITLEISVKNLAYALKSLQNTPSDPTMRLQKIGDSPFLVIRGQSKEGRGVVTQEVPVQTLPGSAAQRYQEPHIEDPVVSLAVPIARSLYAVVDHYRTLSKMALCEADGERRTLCLSVHHAQIAMRSVFSELENVPPAEGAALTRVAVKVRLHDMKKVLKMAMLMKAGLHLHFCGGHNLVAYIASEGTRYSFTCLLSTMEPEAIEVEL